MENTKLLELLESILGKSKRTNKGNHAFYCPFCHHHNKKLEIQLNTNSSGENDFHCWICNKRGKKLTTLFKYLKVDGERLSQLYKILNIAPVKSIDDIFKDTFESEVRQVELPKEYKPLWMQSDSIEYKNALHYITKKRNITFAEIVKYNIGYCETGEYAKMIIIPSYDCNGQLNYFVGRSYYNKDGFKHKNPDVNKNIVGFELFINWQLPIVLVEGSFDAIAIKHNAIPLFGKTISEELRKKIITNRVQDLYVCLDQDAKKEATEHAEYFMNNGVNVYFVDLAQKDPGEIGFEKMIDILTNTKPFTFGDLITLKFSL